jgi:hypothetical protein
VSGELRNREAAPAASCAVEARPYDDGLVDRNSTPTLSPVRHTRRHRLGAFGGKTRANSGGRTRTAETDTQAPPSDILISMPRSHGEASSNLSLTI